MFTCRRPAPRRKVRGARTVEGRRGAARHRCRVGHARSGTEEREAYARRERRPSPFRCATGCFDATCECRGPDDACHCRADRPSAQRETSGGPLEQKLAFGPAKNERRGSPNFSQKASCERVQALARSHGWAVPTAERYRGFLGSPRVGVNTVQRHRAWPDESLGMGRARGCHRGWCGDRLALPSATDSPPVRPIGYGRGSDRPWHLAPPDGSVHVRRVCLPTFARDAVESGRRGSTHGRFLDCCHSHRVVGRVDAWDRSVFGGSMGCREWG